MAFLIRSINVVVIVSTNERFERFICRNGTEKITKIDALKSIN